MSSSDDQRVIHDSLSHLMGRKAADVRQAIEFQDDPQAFTIIPVQLSKKFVWGAVVGYLILIPTVALIIGYSQGKPISLTEIIIIFAFGLGMAIFFVSLSVHLKRNAMKIGPLLIIEKQTGKVILPRQNKLFNHSEILHLQVITGFDEHDEAYQEVTEINLVTMHDGQRMRWPVTGRIHNYYKRKFVIDRLLDETDMPVMYYKQKWKKNVLVSVKTRDLREA